MRSSKGQVMIYKIPSSDFPLVSLHCGGLPRCANFLFEVFES